jgi:hypothetical protein
MPGKKKPGRVRPRTGQEENAMSSSYTAPSGQFNRRRLENRREHEVISFKHEGIAYKDAGQ